MLSASKRKALSRQGAFRFQERLLDSLWFVPGLFVLGGIVLGSALLWVEVSWGDVIEPALPWFFQGSPDGSRALLSSITTSLMTVVGVVFSITIVALQLASTQFTPRVMRGFMRDRVNQVVLGTFIGTFAYAQIVLRGVKARDGRELAADFVPSLAVTVAFILSLVCLGLLIYFIHHTARSVQASTLIDAVRRDTMAASSTLFPSAGEGIPGHDPEQLREEAIYEEGEPFVVRADRTGFLQAIDEELIVETLPEAAQMAYIPNRVGGWVLQNAPLLHIWPRDAIGSEVERLCDAFVIAEQRSIYQDPLFGIRQLVDIALKALSPGVNDPTTAEDALSALGAILADLANRHFPEPVRNSERSHTRLVFRRPDYAEYTAAAFDQIRRTAVADIHVLMHILGVIDSVCAAIPLSPRRRTLASQAERILAEIEQIEPSSERHFVRTRAERILRRWS